MNFKKNVLHRSNYYGDKFCMVRDHNQVGIPARPAFTQGPEGTIAIDIGVTITDVKNKKHIVLCSCSAAGTVDMYTVSNKYCSIVTNNMRVYNNVLSNSNGDFYCSVAPIKISLQNMFWNKLKSLQNMILINYEELNND